MGIQLLLAGLLMQAYGTYAAVWREDFGWSKTALAVAFSLQRAERGLLAPAQGWLLEKFGPRNVIRVGIVVFGIGFVLLSQINSLTSFYLTLLLMTFGTSLSGPISLNTIIVNWFERKRATALAVMSMGMSIGGLAVPLVAWSITAFGWHLTAFLSGIIILAVGLPITQLIRSNPEDHGFLPDGAPQQASRAAEDAGPSAEVVVENRARHNFTVRQAVRTRAFWFLSVGHALAVTVVSAVIVHLVVHLNEGLGYSIQAAATIVALMTGSMMIGQIAGGFLGDRFNKRTIAALAMVGHAAGLLALAYAGSLAWVVFFAIVHGIAWGIRGPQIHALRADYFGRPAFPTILGFSSVIVMLGGISGPIIAGYMADLFGNYQLGFTILSGLAAFGSIFFIFAREPTV